MVTPAAMPTPQGGGVTRREWGARRWFIHIFAVFLPVWIHLGLSGNWTVTSSACASAGRRSGAFGRDFALLGHTSGCRDFARWPGSRGASGRVLAGATGPSPCETQGDPGAVFTQNFYPSPRNGTPLCVAEGSVFTGGPGPGDGALLGHAPPGGWDAGGTLSNKSARVVAFAGGGNANTDDTDWTDGERSVAFLQTSSFGRKTTDSA